MTPNNQPAWLPKYLNGSIDGVFLITAGTLTDAQGALGSLAADLGPAVTLLEPEVGTVRPGVFRGHEHFGFLDGVSQPAIDGLGTAFPGQRTIDTGRFVFGYGVTQMPPLSWMRNGSFMVLRRLKQLVPEFAATLESEGERLGMDGELLGARMMGRWQSGAQVVDTPLQDDAELGGDPLKNNFFDFEDDLFQRGCPYGAHIRKVNPRHDLLLIRISLLSMVVALAACAQRSSNDALPSQMNDTALSGALEVRPPYGTEVRGLRDDGIAGLQ